MRPAVVIAHRWLHRTMHEKDSMTELAYEQAYLDQLFARRDELLLAAAAERTEAQLLGDPLIAQSLDRRIQSLESAAHKLCFGRLDLDSGDRYYIGRVGLSNPDTDADPMLVDWRAPVASAFYTATFRAPAGVAQRRHLHTAERLVLSINDEVLTGTSASDVVGEAALLAALNSRRTGQMQDVVATIQSEQDTIIRASHRTPIVVQGGPGTGKTAVALHRAAYLLFNHSRIAERGVLVIGPSRVFLDYIEQVLPALGETQVAASRIDDLLPGVEITETDDSAAAAAKSDLSWPARLEQLVISQRHLAVDEDVVIGGEQITVPTAELVRLSARALSTYRAHNEAGLVFADLLRDWLADRLIQLRTQGLADVERGLEDLLERATGAIDRDLGGYAKSDAVGIEVDGAMSRSERLTLRRGLNSDSAIDDLVDRVWPQLNAADLLRAVLADPAQFNCTLPAGAPSTRKGWSSADVALLDELTELIGGDAVESIDGTLAEQALADRSWTYGHAVIDEAQELSPMQWRMVMRRCPTKSLTIVGDVDQTSSPDGANDWSDALDAHLGDRWQLNELTINYRTPRQVMELAEQVRARIGSTVRAARALREGVTPHQLTSQPAELGTMVIREVERLRRAYDGGSVAIIAGADVPDELREAARGTSLMTPETAKGLEFDAVIVIDPAGIEAAERGANLLYVAMTRCTQELVLISLYGT